MNTDDLRYLWLSVLVQACRDARAPEWDSKAEVMVARYEARSWIEGGGKDFQHVCALAGVEPTVVQQWWRIEKARRGW